MLGKCFASNLGTRAIQCNPQDVSGTQRYRFFATALTSHKDELKTNQVTQSKSESRKVRNNVHPPSFQENGTQYDEVKAITSPSSTNNAPPSESQQLTKIQLEKITREKERKEQEAALPPFTDKESLKAYRVFLEDNKKKDFVLREKELDEKMKQKLKIIEDDLYARYSKDSKLNEEKIEVQ